VSSDIGDREALERYERAVLEVSGTLDPPIERWSRVYDLTSKALTSEAAEIDPGPTGLLRPSGFEAADANIVWGLIYGARTYAIARWLLAETPPAEGVFVELGAGWGPFGLAAASLGHRVVLVDLSAERLRSARSMFAALGFREPQCLVEDAWSFRLPAEAGSIALPYSFGEMLRGRRDELRAGAQRLKGWLGELGPSGRMFVVEPGTHVAARRLQAIRDLLAPEIRISAPCPQIAACPALPNPEDWCHFTRRLPLGAVGQAVAAAGRRRWQEVHFSYLVFGTSALPGVARVLEVREESKRKVRVRACTESGLVQLTALSRERDIAQSLLGLVPATAVRIDFGACEPKGDGLRVRSASAVELAGDVSRGTGAVD
jgi:hypothetical protein